MWLATTNRADTPQEFTYTHNLQYSARILHQDSTIPDLINTNIWREPGQSAKEVQLKAFTLDSFHKFEIISVDNLIISLLFL